MGTFKLLTVCSAAFLWAKKSRPEPASGILAVPSLLKTFSSCLSYQSATIGAQRTEDGGGNGHQQLENFHHGVSCDFHGTKLSE